ncbi:MAG: von Willebrand factor type domain [Chthonomonadales bacterium]|nr:von Willebrand factor type domain [Chthonomonadales bacterium]
MSAPQPSPTGSLSILLALLDKLLAFLTFLSQLLSANGRKRVRARRPWQIRIRGKQQMRLRRDDVERLIQRQQALKDLDKIAALSGSFRTPESSFFADPVQIEALIRRLLKENPPWLYLSRVLSGGEQGGGTHSSEMIYREQETREMQEVTLFIPDEVWRDKPLASLTMQPTRNLNEVWQARMLDQILPPTLLLDRHQRGEILIPVRQKQRQRLEFLPEQRSFEQIIRKQIPIPIETESGSGRGGQLLYFLLDSSASMRGQHATLAMTVIACVLRANMGQRDTRYLFRHFSDEVWPPVLELPLQARTVQEKDRLFDTILTTNFNGIATHVNDALSIVLSDIAKLRREENLDAGVLLVTDGRSEIMPSTQQRFLEAHVLVHSVMVVPERNPSLEAFSETFTTLDITPPA